jgi:hypothetical protein
MWWFMPVISALRRRQKNEEFKASLDYTVRLKKKKKVGFWTMNPGIKAF